MFKNFIIIILFFLLCSLMIQKPDNAKLLISDLAASKDMVIDGTDYIQKTFSKEFSVVEEKFEEFEQNKSAESPLPIIEETWFNEK